MKIFQYLRYLDNLVAVGAALATYFTTRDESQLADAVFEQIIDALEESEINTGVLTAEDLEKIRGGLVQVIDGIEPLF